MTREILYARALDRDSQPVSGEFLSELVALMDEHGVDYVEYRLDQGPPKPAPEPPPADPVPDPQPAPSEEAGAQ